MHHTSRSAIRLRDVTKSVGLPWHADEGFHGLSLTIARGTFVSIMAPKGIGKTLLFKLIAGLAVPDTGAIWIDDVKASDLTRWELAALRFKTLGLVSHESRLDPVLNVVENVGWPLALAGYRGADRSARVDAALARVGMTPGDTRVPVELSRGEQRRVAIARAIVVRPSILLADEPSGNLDSRTRQSILDVLRELNRRESMTILLVTHDVLTGMWGDRSIVLRAGRIVRDVIAPSVVYPK